MQQNYNNMNMYGYPQYSLQGQPNQYQGMQPNQMQQYQQNANMQQPNQMQMQRQGNIQFLIVNTEEEAKAYLVPIGFKAYILDTNNKKFFIKATDINGNSSYEEYSLSIPQKQQVEYATKNEILNVYAQIDNINAILTQLTSQRNNKNNNNNLNVNENQNPNGKGGK